MWADMEDCIFSIMSGMPAMPSSGTAMRSSASTMCDAASAGEVPTNDGIFRLTSIDSRPSPFAMFELYTQWSSSFLSSRAVSFIP